MNEWKNYDIMTYILPFKIEFTIVEKKRLFASSSLSMIHYKKYLLRNRFNVRTKVKEFVILNIWKFLPSILS